MPFLALVYVRDADAARALIQEHRNSDSTGKVVGLYRLPAHDEKLCRGWCVGKRGMNPWRRHQPGGFMICGVCGNRHKDSFRRAIGGLFDSFGINLLPRNRTPRAYQNPETWGN